jgi:hypothetical protein
VVFGVGPNMTHFVVCRTIAKRIWLLLSCYAQVSQVIGNTRNLHIFLFSNDRIYSRIRQAAHQCPLCELKAPTFYIDQHEMSKDPARPNVVIVLADNLGWGELGCYSVKRSMAAPFIGGF